jgi:hypothetical protein
MLPQNLSAWYNNVKVSAMSETNISTLRSIVSAGCIVWTEHLALRLRERQLKRADVVKCIHEGEIIELYPSDMPFPSCLILGTDVDGRPLHVVCAQNPGVSCCIITAYYPDPCKWEGNNKIRKVVK